MASAETESPLVLVTGASGFLGTHIVKTLQEEGYRVRGTVRALDNDTKVKPLHDLCPDAAHKLELVEADLNKPESWEPAVKECTYVIHVASPFPATAGASDDDVVKPAVDGTNAILKACQQAKVKRLIVTSSVVAVTGGMTGGIDGTKSFSEEDWGDPEKASDVYAKSKIQSEKAAWDFVKELSDEEKFEVATILPGFMMGPVLCGGTATSMEVPRRLLERSMPAVPKLFFPLADVRDVAVAHVKAMTIPEAAGQRHIVYTSGHWLKEVAQVMAKEFKPQGYCVPTLHCPYFVVWVKSLFDKTIKMTLPSIGKSVKINNSRMSEVLQVEPHPLNETILDMCYTMIERGFIKKAKKYRGPKKEGEEEEQAEEKAAEDAKEANGAVSTGGEDKAEGEGKAEEAQEAKEAGQEEEKKAAEGAPADEAKTEEVEPAAEEAAPEAKEAVEVKSGAAEEAKSEEPAEAEKTEATEK